MKNDFKSIYFNPKFFRAVSTEEGRALARTWNVPFVEVSAMDLEVRLNSFFSKFFRYQLILNRL